MDADITAAWELHAAPFTRVVEAVTDWDADSPCEGWTARDVVEHVIDTERDFLEARGHALEPADASDPGAIWRAHAASVQRLLDDPAVAATPYAGAFGDTTVGETLATFYGFDLLVHRWDLARSQGADEQLTEVELAEADAAIDSFGEHAYGPGVFGAPIEVGADATRQQRVLARAGRVA